MGDSLKLSKDKRHRSSSSLAGVVLDGTLSERKIDIKASIPEVEDHFAIAEARCEDLQDKIDFVKNLKRKRKLKKRSTTRLVDQQISSENVPYISVRTQPKKKVMPQAARLHRVETPLNPTRSYLDPAILEQRRIITKNNENNVEHGISWRLPRVRTGRESGDGTCGQSVQITTTDPLQNMSGNDDNESYVREQRKMPKYKRSKPLIEEMHHIKKKFLKQKSLRRSSLSGAFKKKLSPEPVISTDESSQEDISNLSGQVGTSGQTNLSPVKPSKLTCAERRLKYILSKNDKVVSLDDSVVELYNKNHSEHSPNTRQYMSPEQNRSQSPPKQNKEGVVYAGDTINTPPKETPEPSPVRKPKCKLRRHYELPTLSSSLKQKRPRAMSTPTRKTRFPFIISKSTTPSHNIGANIQQVLNRFKVKQPLSGVPSTLAQQMGLSSERTNINGSANSPGEEINYIKLGEDRLHVRTNKYRSFRRLLNLYQEGNVMVRKFLRSFDDAHISYTSLYNVVTNREDPDGATSKGHGTEMSKKGLAEYAYLVRVYQAFKKNVNTKNNPKLASVRNRLERQLTAKEGHIRKVMQRYRNTSSGAESDEPHDDDDLSTYDRNAGDGTN